MICGFSGDSKYCAVCEETGIQTRNDYLLSEMGNIQGNISRGESICIEKGSILDIL